MRAYLRKHVGESESAYKTDQGGSSGPQKQMGESGYVALPALNSFMLSIYLWKLYLIKCWVIFSVVRFYIFSVVYAAGEPHKVFETRRSPLCRHYPAKATRFWNPLTLPFPALSGKSHKVFEPAHAPFAGIVRQKFLTQL